MATTNPPVSQDSPASTAELLSDEPVQTVIVITNRSDLMEYVPIEAIVDPSDLNKGRLYDEVCSSPGSHCPLKAGWFPNPQFMNAHPMLGTYSRTA